MPDPVIDEIKSRLDIGDLISQRVQLKRAGRYLKGLCPFHGEKSPSFVVYPDQGTYHCFGCGKSGDVFTWLQETENLDFGETLRRLADQTGVKLPERSHRAPDPEQIASADALTEAAAWYHEQLLRAEDAKPARDYLVRRGIKGETAREFRLGWAPERRDALVLHLRAKGITDQQLIDAGLVRETERGLLDYMHGRVVFPIRDPEGKVRGFGGRTLGDTQPKYLNSPQSTFFDKSATLYGLDLARGPIRKEGVAVIVEGYMDVVVPHQEGFANVVASLGTALTERQLEILKRYAPTIILALDSDAAGQAATLRGLEVARQALAESKRPVPGRASRGGFLQTQSSQLKIAVVSGGKDPDEIVRDDPGAWRRIVENAVPMLDHKINVTLKDIDLSDPNAKIVALREVVRFLVQVPNSIEWGHYVDVLAQRLRLDMRAVQTEVQNAARTLRDEERRRQAQPASSPSSRAVQTAAVRKPTAGDPQGAQTGRSARSARAQEEEPDVLGEPEEPSLDTDAEDEPGAGSSTSPAAAAASLASFPSTPPRRPNTMTASGEELTEEHLLSFLVLSPQAISRLPSRLLPEDFRRPECRELFRVLSSSVGVAAGAPLVSGPEWPGAVGDQAQENAGTASAKEGDEEARYPLSAQLDEALRPFYEMIVSFARSRPPQTESQIQAAVVDMVRRLRERNLHQRVLEAQYLLTEANEPDEKASLIRQVGQLSSQLLRVQLERSRASLYTSPPG
jgi:DNA primase